MRVREYMAQLWREPLLHFLVAGAAIFFFFGWNSSAVDAESRRIVVDKAQVQRLASMWSQSWQRPPTPGELDGLIRDYIKEEVYYREARRIGLDQDDAVVRRRLRSKMEFLATSEAENAVPSDAVLRAWLDKYPARYASEPVIGFDSVYVSTAEGNEIARAKAARLLARLEAGDDPTKLDDPISLPRSVKAASKQSIGRQFGEDFAAALLTQPKGKWVGPLTSGFGLHLVRVTTVDAAHKATLTDVRQQVENDWRAATREQRENRAYQTLLDGYDIDIERPE